LGSELVSTLDSATNATQVTEDVFTKGSLRASFFVLLIKRKIYQ